LLQSIAETNKCLAQSNKSETEGKATKKRPDDPGAHEEPDCGEKNMNATVKIVMALGISASIMGTANAQGKIYGPPATTAYAMAPTSTVIHNGSLMEVYDRGGRMEIRYAEPRPGLANIGVTPGTLLVKGAWVVPEKFEGTAYIFTTGCPALPYRVKGGVDRFGNILFSGPVPVTDYACNIVGYDWKNHNAYLRFDQATER